MFTKIEKKILDRIRSEEEALIDFTKKLISTPSVNPPGDERKVVEVITKEFKRLGLKNYELVAKEKIDLILSAILMEKVIKKHYCIMDI